MGEDGGRIHPRDVCIGIHGRLAAVSACNFSPWSARNLRRELDALVTSEILLFSPFPVSSSLFFHSRVIREQRRPFARFLRPFTVQDNRNG